jgi:hypothetical protein
LNSRHQEFNFSLDINDKYQYWEALTSAGRGAPNLESSKPKGDVGDHFPAGGPSVSWLDVFR